MRRAQYEVEIDGSASYAGDQVPSGNMTRGSLIVSVGAYLAPDGVVKLQGSNEAPSSTLVQGRDVSETSWADIPGAALQLDVATLASTTTFAIPVELSYRFVRVVYTRTGGSAALTLRLELKGWP